MKARTSLATWLPLLVVFAALFGALFASTPASALERNFVGSAQVDYHFVPLHRDAKVTPAGFDGFTMELAGKLAVDFNEHLSANMKLCFGCHGVEADMMYFDYRVADELNIRMGRFSPTFGSFNLRHDVANHRLSDKPLPYDMGRMLRMRDFNMGVLPSPFPDNGVEVNGVHWFGESIAVEYAAYAVSGFKGETGAKDLDFRLSRSAQSYYIDNNARPTYGGRVGVQVKFASKVDMSLGGSVMRGTWDPDNKYTYLITGGDLSFRFDRTNVRLEYLVRRQEFDQSDPSSFKFTVLPNSEDYFLKHGAYVEIEQPITKAFDLIGRADGLFRVGNVERESILGKRASIMRGTLGMAYAIEQGLRFKASTELWKFSDQDGTGRDLELGFHTGVAGTF